MSKVSVITSVAWVERGVAAEKPDRVALDAPTIQELMGASEAEPTEEDTTGAEEEERPAPGLRGSAKVPPKEGDEYNMEGYDEEKTTEPSIKGLSVFANPLDDPYVTKTVDSEDEAEVEDLKVRATDNLAVAAKFESDDATLIVYLYNSEGDFYVHHDYPVAAPILCLEPFKYDPGVESKKGNLLAVGTMNPEVEVWDLDVVNAVKPVLRLGAQKKGNRKKRDGSSQAHSDSVLSLAWNREADHLLASGGADSTVVLWDLDEAKAAQQLPADGMVQCLEWAPGKSSVLLSGSRAGAVRLNDCQSSEVVELWNQSGVEVEAAHFDRFDPQKVFFMTSDGKLRLADVRQPGKLLAEVEAHSAEGSVFSQSAQPGLVATAGEDVLKLWHCSAAGFELLNERPLNLGRLHSAAFCPDLPGVLLVGGDKGDLVRVLDVSKTPAVKARFPGLAPVQPAAELERDQADVEMADA